MKPLFLFISLLVLVSACNNADIKSHPSEDEAPLPPNEEAPIPPNLELPITFLSPHTSIGNSATPSLQVSMLEIGDKVGLYSDHLCTNELIFSESLGSTMVLTTSPLQPGKTQFYVKASRGIFTSDCYQTLEYTYLECPEGYSFVDSTDSPFCVMKYEAKKGLNNLPESKEESMPWINISYHDSQAACQALNTHNGVSEKYDLISNPEWLIISKNIESVGANWRSNVPEKDNTVNYGCLKQGNNGLSDDCSYSSGTVDYGPPSAEREDRSKLLLSNSEEVWDLSGNIWEWVDWKKEPGLQFGPTTCAFGYQNFFNFSCADMTVDEYLPSVGIEANYWGYGFIQGGGSGAPLRGGAYYSLNVGGLFALSMNDPASMEDSSVGFRCVFRP